MAYGPAPTGTGAFPGATAASPFPGSATPAVGTGDGVFGPSMPTGPEPDRGAGAVLLVVGLVLAVLAVAAGWLLGRSVTVAVVAWAVAGPVVIGLLALHVRQETRAQARLFAEQPSAAVRLLYWGVVAAALAGIVVNALRIAEWAGRL
jgi:hypothetical protein